MHAFERWTDRQNVDRQDRACIGYASRTKPCMTFEDECTENRFSKSVTALPRSRNVIQPHDLLESSKHSTPINENINFVS